MRIAAPAGSQVSQSNTLSFHTAGRELKRQAGGTRALPMRWFAWRSWERPCRYARHGYARALPVLGHHGQTSVGARGMICESLRPGSAKGGSCEPSMLRGSWMRELGVSPGRRRDGEFCAEET
jgi:hypothetical protein